MAIPTPGLVHVAPEAARYREQYGADLCWVESAVPCIRAAVVVDADRLPYALQAAAMLTLLEMVLPVLYYGDPQWEERLVEQGLRDVETPGGLPLGHQMLEEGPPSAHVEEVLAHLRRAAAATTTTVPGGGDLRPGLLNDYFTAMGELAHGPYPAWRPGVDRVFDIIATVLYSMYPNEPHTGELTAWAREVLLPGVTSDDAYRDTETVWIGRFLDRVPVREGVNAPQEWRTTGRPRARDYDDLYAYLHHGRPRTIRRLEHELLNPAAPAFDYPPDWEQLDRAIEGLSVREARRCAGAAVDMIVDRADWPGWGKELPAGSKWHYLAEIWEGKRNGTIPLTWLQVEHQAWTRAARIERALTANTNRGARLPEGITREEASAAYHAAEAVRAYARAMRNDPLDEPHPYWLQIAVGEATRAWAFEDPAWEDEDEPGADPGNLRHEFWALWWARCQRALGVRRKGRGELTWETTGARGAASNSRPFVGTLRGRRA